MSGTGTLPSRKWDKWRRLFKPSREPSLVTPAVQPPSQGLSQTALPANSCNQQQPGEQFLARALERLDPEIQATIRELNCHEGDVTSAIAQALAAASDQKRVCEGKRWRWKVRGHEVFLQDVADKTIFWLDRFKAAGNIAVNADPIHAGLLWAGFRVILEVRRANIQNRNASKLTKL